MATRVLNRVYHPPSDDYVYWSADAYDPTGIDYPGSPPFLETIDPVVVALADAGSSFTGIEVLVNESAPEANDVPGSNPNAYQDYSQIATARININTDLTLPFVTIKPSSGETLVDIEYFT
jgi:hypothetical protein